MPVLIKLSHPDPANLLIDWYFTNEIHDIKWEGRTYRAVPMGYKAPTSRDGIPSGGSLEIDVDIQDERGDELLAWFDQATDKAEMEVVAVIHDEGIRPIGLFKHRNGSVTWDGKKISWNPGWDNRLQMQVNPVTFNFDELTG